MVWIAVTLFAAAGIALILARGPAAHAQALIAGGRIGPGCVVAEGVVFLLLALLALLFRDVLR